MSGTRIASVSGLRGIVGDGLDPASIVEFAAAYASGLSEGASVLIAHDGRPTASVFLHAVVAGVTATGCHARILGPTATPTIGFLLRSDPGDGSKDRNLGGIQISASHNPPEYNGLKFFQQGGMVVSPEEGRAVLDRFDKKHFCWVSWDRVGSVIDAPHEDGLEHRQKVLSLIDGNKIREHDFRVLLDGCHGGGGPTGVAFLRSLGCHVIGHGVLPDGNYDHPPEPTEANLSGLAKLVSEQSADVGFVQDPDADRLAIIDETGRYIGEELTLALCALQSFKKRRGTVVLNLSTSRVTEEIAARYDCPVERTAVGEINVVNRMIATDAMLGGEGNGGIIDPRVGFVRDSIVGIGLVLELLAEEGKPLSRIVDELPRWEMVKEKYPLTPGKIAVTELFDRLISAYPDARADRTDGLRLDWEDRWVHVRASNTEPIVRVIAEARDRGRASELAHSLGRWVRGDEH